MATINSSQKSIRTGLLCLLGALFFLLASSSGAWSQKVAGKGQLLAAKHKTAGINCAQCHKEKPSSPVPTATCVSCHKDMDKVTAAKKPNFHDAHIPFPECESCHHVHKPSENKCADCHDFEVKTP